MRSLVVWIALALAFASILGIGAVAWWATRPAPTPALVDAARADGPDRAGHVDTSLEAPSTATARRTVEAASAPRVSTDPLIAGTSDIPPISGVLVDDVGTPRADVLVNGRTPSGNSLYPTALTDENGRFTLRLNVSEPHGLEVAECETHTGLRFDSAKLTAPGTSDVRLVTPRFELVRFRVVDAATRAPIERFGLSLSRDGSGWEFVRGTGSKVRRSITSRSSSDSWGGLATERRSDGELRVRAQPGRMRVRVWTEDDHARHESIVSLDPGSADTQTIALVRGATITGRVVGEPGSPNRAHVRLSRQPLARATSSAPGGTQGLVVIERPGSLPWLTRDTVEPEPAFDVDAFAARDGDKTPADTDGRFAFEGLASGTYALSLRSSASLETRVEHLHVGVGQRLDVGDVTLNAGATLRGRLLVPPGESPTGFVVVARGRRAKAGASTPDPVSPRADGTFELRALEPGSWRIDWRRADSSRVARFEEMRPNCASCELGAGQTLDVVLDATRSTPCRVRVLVTSLTGPLENAQVRVTSVPPRGERPAERTASASARSTILGVTDARGRMEGTVDGDESFRLEVASAGTILGTDSRVFTATPGGEMACELTVDYGTVWLDVRSEAALADVDLAQVLLESSEGPVAMLGWRRRVSDSGSGFAPDPVVGRTLLGLVPPGKYGVSVSRFRVKFASTLEQVTGVEEVMEPFTTTVTVESGREATIVLP